MLILKGSVLIANSNCLDLSIAVEVTLVSIVRSVQEYPDKAEVKSKSRLSPPQKSNNERPAVAFPPEPSLPKKDHSIKGGLAELQKHGIKITSYSESNTK